jgi:HSP20 family molecular chaperone IbpA
MMNGESIERSKRTDAAEKLHQRPFAAPLVDIYENSDELLIVADLPGVESSDLNVHFEKGQLAIEARLHAPVEGTVLAAEWRPLDFRRTFVVPQGINADRISAELHGGVLHVHLPKADSLKPRQIQIRT